MTRDPGEMPTGRSGSTDRLVRELARELEPVRRVPPLRTAFAALLGVWAALAALALAGLGPRAHLVTTLVRDPLYAGVLGGLLLTAVGGGLGALAARIPGREAVVRWGGALALAGLGLAVGACVVALVEQGALPGWQDASPGACLARGTALTLVAGAALVSLALRGWVERPLPAAAVALVGGSAVGAVLVHVTCRAPVDPLHLLLGHALLPVALGAIGALPLGAVLRRWAR